MTETSTPQTWTFDQYGRSHASATLTDAERVALWLARIRGTATDKADVR